jgi:FkbM family methyltransferase
MQKISKGLNSLVKFIQCNEVPGKFRLYEATKLKYSKKLITYTIKGAEFSIPWDQWCFWKNYGPENYYLEEILPFTDILNNHLESFDLFDLGADVGVVSALVNKHCEGLNNIIAAEPNPTVFNVLKENLLNISPKHTAFNQAISNFNGNALFNFNSDQGSDHEGHLMNGSIGDTEVISLDSLVEKNQLELSKDLAIKIDIEGQEKAMFAGASNTIKQADKIIVLLELHPDVLTRDNQTPEELFIEAEKLRDFTWLVPIQGNKEVDRHRDFYQQFPLQQYDIIGIAN